MQKVDRLIRTKLHLPFTRPELVSRPRLQERILQGLRCPLILITAPAGFGKTTLIASCVAHCGLPVAWLSLDKDDNQTGRFLIYLTAALQGVDQRIGNEAAQLLSGMQQASLEAVLTSLINDLDVVGAEIILVLDDYQFITSSTVNTQLSFLIEHCPLTLHLLIATRSDPPLSLARLRAGGQMVELRAADLRFTPEEAKQFLNDMMGLHLSAKAVASLEEQTEGWIAGLQMAALSMRDRKDVDAFIEGFSGTNRYILDYLLEEVLAQQPPEIQQFLLYTSILERLIAPLCDAILVPSGAINNDVHERKVDEKAHSITRFVGQSTSTLEYLERANLFLVPLDDERKWFRYHHLFADLLLSRLNQLDPLLAPILHARAAIWLEHEGMMVEAVNHTLAAGKYDHAALLVEKNTTRLLAQGELNAVVGWIEALPVDLRQSRPWLCIHQAYALAFAGRLSEVSQLLNQAETILESEAGSLTHHRDQALAGSIAALRSMTAEMMGQDAEAIVQAQLARKLLPDSSINDRITASWALGFAMHSQGNLPDACAAFEEQSQLGRIMDNTWALLSGQTYLAQVLRTQGQLYQARDLLKDVLAEASRRGVRGRGYIAFVEANLASILYEQNELEDANQLLNEAVVLTRQWPNPNFLVFIYALLGCIQLALGNPAGAREAIGEANRVYRSAALTRLDQRWVEAEIVRVWLALQTKNTGTALGDPLAERSGAILAG